MDISEIGFFKVTLFFRIIKIIVLVSQISDVIDGQYSRHGNFKNWFLWKSYYKVTIFIVIFFFWNKKNVTIWKYYFKCWFGFHSDWEVKLNVNFGQK